MHISIQRVVSKDCEAAGTVICWLLNILTRQGCHFMQYTTTNTTIYDLYKYEAVALPRVKLQMNLTCAELDNDITTLYASLRQ